MSYVATVDLFRPCTIDAPGAPRMAGYGITCAKCGKQDKVSSQRAHLPAEAVSRMFTGRGWNVSSRNPRHHLCPDCNSPSHKSKVIPMAIVKAAPLAKNVAEAPAEMTREDRRIIFAKLNEVYVDEKVGYSDSWSDQRVANDLNIPRGWVTSIREENFGPDGASEEVRGILAQAKTLANEARVHIESVERIRQSVEDLAKRIAVVETAKGPLKDRLERVEGHVSRISKQVGLQ